MYPDMARQGQDVAVPLNRLAELWIAYYRPFADDLKPIAQRGHTTGNDMAFRPLLTHLREEWQQAVQLSSQAADGFFLLTEMRTPRRRDSCPATLQRVYERAVASIVNVIHMPIQYAGAGHWSVFEKPAPYGQLFSAAMPLPRHAVARRVRHCPSKLVGGISSPLVLRRSTVFVRMVSLHGEHYPKRRPKHHPRGSLYLAHRPA